MTGTATSLASLVSDEFALSAEPPPEPVYACMICKDAGSVRSGAHDAWGAPVYQTCRCVHQRRIERLVKESGIGAYRQMTFATFQAHGEQEEAAKRVALEYADNPAGRWLYIAGSFGTGKTHLAAAVCNVLLDEGKSVFFQPVPDLLDLLKAGFQDGSYHERLEWIKTVDVLVFDDFGTESGTDWAAEKLFQIADHRYRWGLPIIWTTNKRISQIPERLASRIGDRARVAHIKLTGRDRRFGDNDVTHPDAIHA